MHRVNFLQSKKAFDEELPEISGPTCDEHVHLTSEQINDDRFLWAQKKDNNKKKKKKKQTTRGERE